MYNVTTVNKISSKGDVWGHKQGRVINISRHREIDHKQIKHFRHSKILPKECIVFCNVRMLSS